MSAQENESGMTRRDVLKGTVRIGALAGLVMGLTVLAGRSGACEIKSPCERCRKFKSCDLDKAQEARRAR